MEWCINEIYKYGEQDRLVVSQETACMTLVKNPTKRFHEVIRRIDDAGNAISPAVFNLE